MAEVKKRKRESLLSLLKTLVDKFAKSGVTRAKTSQPIGTPDWERPPATLPATPPPVPMPEVRNNFQASPSSGVAPVRNPILRN